MATSIPPLFASFLQISDSSAAFNFIVRHPVLLSPTLLNSIQEHVDTMPRKKQSDLQASLNVLIGTHEFLSRNLNDYPYGEGPLDKIFMSLFQNQLSLKSALDLARSEKTSSLLSPLYIRFITTLAKNQANTQPADWQKYHQMVTITLECVKASPPDVQNEEWFRMKAVIIAAYIDVTTTGLIYLPDRRLLEAAHQMGEGLIDEAAVRDDPETILTMCHMLGLLYLDPWFSNKTTSHYPTQFKLWRNRIFDHYGDKLAGMEPETYLMPYPTQTIDQSIRYLDTVYHTLKIDAGPALLKALGDAHMWKSVLIETNDFTGAIPFFEMAIQACEEDSSNRVFIENIQQRIDFCKKSSTERVTDHALGDTLLQTSHEELIAGNGYLNLFTRFSQAINQFNNTEPTKALALWQKANEILTENYQEDFALAHYQTGVRVMAAFFAIEKEAANKLTVREEYLLLKNNLTAGTISELQFYVKALLAAFYGTSTNEEEDGIAIIKELTVGGIPHDEVKPFIPLINFLMATLHLNAAAESWNKGNVMRAIDRYFEAMQVFLVFRFPRFVRDILSRLEDIASLRHEEHNARILVHLTYKALGIESLSQPYLSETCQRIYLDILLSHTPAGGGKTNPVVLAFLAQLMKGYAFNVQLQSPPARNLLEDEEVTRLFETIDTLEKETTDTTLFDFNRLINKEFLLVSYARVGNKAEGSDVATRLKNCRISLDEVINGKLTHSSESQEDNIRSDKELMALLPSNTVMISQLLAPSSEGQVAVYNFIFTNEEAAFIAGTVTAAESSTIKIEEEGIEVSIPWLGLHVIQIRDYIQKDPDRNGLSRKAAELLQFEAGLLLGGNMKPLLDKFRSLGKYHLCIWPHGPLHYLPFHLLPLNNEPICSQWKISYLPSIGILQRPKPETDAQGVSLLKPLTVMAISFQEGNPQKLASLPHSADEAKAISQVFGITPILENEVTEESFLDAMQNSKRVHLSTHGLFDGNAPIFHCLYLNKSNQSDGLLNAYEVLKYDFEHVDLLTLSACETALGRFDASDNLRGLPAMFFKAGVRTIIGTLWDAESESSQLFFVTLYAALHDGADKFEAFTIAQQKTRQEYPDYRDWGAFIYSGE